MLTPSLANASKLGLALLVGSAAAQAPAPPVVTIVPSADDIALAASQERLFSYGRSPPVFPAPETSGDGKWEDAYRQARELVDQMTNDEKNNLTYGQPSTTGCSGVSGSVPRLGFPGLCLVDNGNGVRNTDGVSGYPSGIHLGATWNKQIVHETKDHLGAEFKRKGANVALGPVGGGLGRIVRGGRNWEGFSNDPFLAGVLLYESVVAMQKHVITSVKHFVGNEQETNRIPPRTFSVGALNQSSSSNIDDKTMHELYMWTFQDAIRAGAGSIMCSYNQLNGSYGCQNSKAMNGLLKGELGFKGFVVSDWGAQHSGISSAKNGMDMAMPNSPYWQNGNLTLMVSNGSLEQSRLDDMAMRILTPYFRFAHFEPGTGLSADLNAPHEIADARDPASEDVLLQSAIEGHVLVKNTNNALPLKKPKMMSVFGYDAVAPSRNTPTGGRFNKWGFGMENTLTVPGLGFFNDTYLGRLFLSNEPWNAHVPGVAYNGTLITGGGSGAVTPAFIDAPLDALQRQARTDRTIMAWDTDSQNPTVNQASDVCLVFINEQSAEGWDRPNIQDQYSGTMSFRRASRRGASISRFPLPFNLASELEPTLPSSYEATVSLTSFAQDDLVLNVAAQCNNTQVIIHNAGIRTVERFIENPNITAVIFAHLPGQETGQSILDILYGKQSPSGRLPYTIAKKPSDYGRLLNPTIPDANSNFYLQDNFTEGIYIDYKDFIARNVTPQYAFGFGLTYSEFSYSDLSSTLANDTTASVQGATYNGNGTHVQPEGGDPDLWKSAASVTCTIKNTGSVAAAEVAQLYLHIPSGPDRVLRGFEKKLLQPGEESEVTFELNRRDMSTWDVEEQAWVLQSGEYGLMVGKSVLDIQLRGSLTVE